MKTLIAILTVVLYAVFASAQEQSTGPTAQGSQTPPVFTKLPDVVLNTELKLLGGKTIKLSDYDGKILVINVFATWCGPCRFEAPVMAKLHKEFASRGVLIVDLSTENSEASEESVREWVWEFKLPYAVGWASPEVALALMNGRESIPQTFIVKRNGDILLRFIGFSPTATEHTMREAIEDALKSAGN